ncbi:YigZ family protein [Corynebacterium pseudopelargi]|uniref:IMPACT family member YigZ n=1 Tax=Corynebacterium pseudopelargi TaxID=2080757 RepID=A0A3G6IWB0_9CORY|nr:YigZ family protein [Corynebacterium pseudopelargi]AZA08948.1 IMPACT family member YigZ [Corynebacterium pseudopelargi]
MYLRPAEEICTAELEIKRSKFLTFIQRADTEEAARDFITAIKSQYPDARHHCSAFICHQEGFTPIERSSDDGEPSGTAGQPMLDVLRGSGVEDIVAVVVRYFGGIKLGAGGLVHAYSEAVSLGLEHLRTVVRKKVDLYNVELTHAQAGPVEARLRAAGVQVLDSDYAQKVTLTLGVEAEGVATLEALVAELTSGAATLKNAGHTWVETPS